MSILTTKQFAEQVGVTSGRIVQLIQNGQLKAEKLGRDYVLDSRLVPLIKHRKKSKGGRPRKSIQGANAAR